MEEGVRRISVGGKLITGYLKEVVSYRSLNMQVGMGGTWARGGAAPGGVVGTWQRLMFITCFAGGGSGVDMGGWVAAHVGLGGTCLWSCLVTGRCMWFLQ